jgi:hypothetical protein
MPAYVEGLLERDGAVVPVVSLRWLSASAASARTVALVGQGASGGPASDQT